MNDEIRELISNIIVLAALTSFVIGTFAAIGATTMLALFKSIFIVAMSGFLLKTFAWD